MEITLEQIDLIMKRANVSYSVAKAALEKAHGDILEALLLLEQDEQFNTAHNNSQAKPKSNTEKFTNFIDKLNATNFIMKKADHVYINIPLSIALIFIILCFHVSIITLIASLIFGIRIHIEGNNDLAEKINSAFDDITK